MSEVVVSIVDTSVEVNVYDQDIVVLSSDTGPQGPQGPRGNQVLSGDTDPSPIVGLVGDQYLNTITGYIFGPKTESGWGSGTLLGNGLQIADVSYVHYQTTSSSVWSISHDLQFTPNIIVVDLSGNVIEGDIKYTGNLITITFSQPITGAAYLS